MNWSVWIQGLPDHMAEAFGSLGRLVSRHGIRNLALAAFLFLTMVATALGLIDLIAASEAGDVSAIEIVVVAALSGTAIITMWLALEFAIEAPDLVRRLLALFIYGLLVLWSIGFGFGFYWRHIASVGVAQDQTHTMIERVNRGLSDSSSALGAISGQMTSLSTAATERASLESNRGGACDNAGATPPGEGNYWSVRRQVSGDVGLVVSTLGTWVSGRDSAGADGRDLPAEVNFVRQQAAAAENDLSQGTREPEAMRIRLVEIGNRARSAIRRTNAIIRGRGPHIRGLNQLADQLERGYGSGPVRCVDRSLARSLRLAAEQLAGLELVDEEAADLTPQLGARATQFAFQRLWKNAFSFLPGEQVEPGGGLDNRDLQALVAAIVVDIGIFFLTLFGRTSDPRGSLDRALRTSRLDPDLRLRLRFQIASRTVALRPLFDALTVRFRNQLYIVTSEDLPAHYDPIRHLQTVLRAAGAGIPVSLRRPFWPGERARLAAFQQQLRHALAAAVPADEQTDFALHDAERITALRIRAELVLTLQRLFSASDGAAEEDEAGDAQVDPPGGDGPAPRRRGAGHGGAHRSGGGPQPEAG